MKRGLAIIAMLTVGCFDEPSEDGSNDGSGTGTTGTDDGAPTSGTSTTPGTSTTGSEATNTGDESGADGTSTGPGCDGPCPGEIDRVLPMPYPFGPSVAAMGSGDLAVLGTTSQEVTYDGVAFPNPSGIDFLLMRIADDGALVWAAQYRGAGAAYAFGLAVAGTEHIAIAGTREGEMSLPDGTLLPTPGVGNAWTVVGVHDGSGAVMDARTVETDASPFGGVDIDTSDRVVLGTSVMGGATIAGTPMLPAIGGLDGLAWRFQVGGATEYAVLLGNVGADSIDNVVYGGLMLGPARVVGTFSNPLTTEEGNVSPVGLRDLFLATVDATGTWQWARRIGGAGDDFARGVTVDPAGNIYVFGHFTDGLEPEPGEGDPVAGTGSSDLVLTKYAPDGEFLWRRTWGGPGEEQARAIAEVDGVLLAVGELRGQTDFDGTVITAPNGSTDGLVLSVDAETGDLRWARGFGGDGDDRILSVATTPDGAWLSLSVSGQVDIAGTTLGAPGEGGSGLVRIAP